MKIVIRTVVFHMSCILIFAFLYYYFQVDFNFKTDNKDVTIMDFLSLSTTIQSGVGISDIYPIDFYGKLVMIIQQILMIMAHVFTLYVFNL